jgi:hypothetical protein
MMGPGLASGVCGPTPQALTKETNMPLISVTYSTQREAPSLKGRHRRRDH